MIIRGMVSATYLCAKLPMIDEKKKKLVMVMAYPAIIRSFSFSKVANVATNNPIANQTMEYDSEAPAITLSYPACLSPRMVSKILTPYFMKTAKSRAVKIVIR